MAGRFLIGTSGFAYPEWKGDFYPADIKSDAMLAFYAQHFPSVEINYTFQTTPEEKTLAKWIAHTPEDFVFSLKAHRAITHMFRLSPGAAKPLEEFLTSCGPLGHRLGAIFFQCPPNMKADLPRLEAFLASLPQGFRYAFEFRHPTWHQEETFEMLRSHGAAWCVADMDDTPAVFLRTASDFVYVRLRKTRYEDEDLAGWAKQIGAALAEGSDSYCYLMHEDQGHGVRYAQKLSDLVTATGSPSPAPEEPASEPFPPETSEGPART